MKYSEGENIELHKIVQELKSELGASNALGQASLKDNERLLKEKGVLTDDIRELECALDSMRQERNDHVEKYVAISCLLEYGYSLGSRLQQANLRCQVSSPKASLLYLLKSQST